MLNALMNALLFWLSGYLRGRLIYAYDGANRRPYLERYSVLRIGSFHLLLHRFLKDDPAPLHDHPWAFSASMIICGKYIQHRRWKKHVVRWFNVLGGDTFHRLEFFPGVYTWSLFFTTGIVKPWGMLEGKIADLTPDAQYSSQYRGDYVLSWKPYHYGAPGNNPLPSKWWKTAQRGNDLPRERRDYVRYARQA